MKRFAALYARLDDTRSTQAKVEAMQAYFAEAPAADAAWGLYFLIGNRLKRLIAPTRLRAWISDATGLAPEVVEESYAHVGDLAETLALLLDRADKPLSEARGLAEWVNWLLRLKMLDEPEQKAQLLEAWARLPMDECFLFNKLLTGALRVGVSSGLAARALAAHAGLDANLIAQRLMGDWQPSSEAYAALIAKADGAINPAQPYPFCLASSLEDSPGKTVEALGAPSEFLIEWKWDGIRAQLIRRAGQTFLWSRGEELLNGRFPEVEAAAETLPDGVVLDGEILAFKDGNVLPFARLQKRIGRKTVGRKLLAEAPVAFMAYDLIEWQGEDWRGRPLAERRARLDEVIAAQQALLISSRLIDEDWSALAARRAESRARGVEGLMLKRLDSPYQTGRKRGAWWKWKIDPMSIDCVLVYAQAGHGRRANLYSDYTLAVWDGPASGEGGLVPVAKAYSGLTDVELTAMDNWIKKHTREKFGPVRSVDPEQVLEIAFEGIQASSRHKAGIALRFPRIARWRRDKKSADANTLDDLKAFLKP